MFLPPRERCVVCSEHTRPLKIQGKGTILSYTVLQVVPEGFEAPLVLAIIEMDDTGGDGEARPPRLVCNGNLPEEELRIGLKVKVTIIDQKYMFTK